jgi:hypothetical protein
MSLNYLEKLNLVSLKKLLHPLAIIIVITLAFGYFVYHASNLVQILLFIAIIGVISAFIFTGNIKKQLRVF